MNVFPRDHHTRCLCLLNKLCVMNMLARAPRAVRRILRQTQSESNFSRDARALLVDAIRPAHLVAVVEGVAGRLRDLLVVATAGVLVDDEAP